MKGSFQKILFFIIGFFSVTSFSYSLAMFFSLTFLQGTISTPALVVSSMAANILIAVCIREGLNLGYRWEGFVLASEKSLKRIRVVHLAFYLICAIFIAARFLFMAPIVDRNSPSVQNAIWQTSLPLQALISLSIFIYCLVGIHGIYTPKMLMLTLNPLQYFLKRRKKGLTNSR